MPYILKVDTSPRQTSSHSRELGDVIAKRILETSPNLDVKTRDTSSTAIAHLSEEMIKGFYTPAEQMTESLRAATQLSDTLIDELNHADTLIISAPMYNFSVPASLKAWIDQVVRIDKTFAYDGENFKGLVPIKKAYLALVYGANGYAPNGAFSSMNFLEPYLISLLSFLGIEEIEVFRIEGTTGDAEALEKAKLEVFNTISSTIK